MAKSRPDPRVIRATAALCCCAVLFFAINTVAAWHLRGARIDLTEQHVYTLSEGTRTTLARLDEPITVRLYYSQRLGDAAPRYGAYARHVQEMLEEYAVRANGRLKLEFIDPQLYSQDEDRAVAFGVQAVPVSDSGDQAYFGIAATNSTDDQQVIAFMHPEREPFLEYDLTKLVHALAFPHRTQVGLLSGLPLEGDMVAAAMRGEPVQPFALMEPLHQLYDVQSLDGDLDRIPDGIDVLMLVHPAGISERSQFAVDQYVLRGGKALVFLDPLSEYQAHNPGPVNVPGMPNASSLDRLMHAWGVTMDPDHVVADRLAARRVNAGVSGQVRVVDYLGWLSLRAPNFNHDDPITADLKLVNVASAGAIEPIAGATTRFVPLISTSLSSMKMPVALFRGHPDPTAILAAFHPEGRSYALAARITGPASTAFPDAPPVKGAAPPLKSSAEPIDVVVVGDTDLLTDRFWVRMSDFYGRRTPVAAANNADFVSNAIEVLAGGPELTALRSRGSAARPFEVVERLQQAAEDRYSAEEHALQDRLRDTKAKLGNLNARDGAGPIVPTADESQAIDNFRGDLLRTRQQLRSVQLALREDIDRLERELKFVDIALMPIVVAIVGIVLGVARRQRRKRTAVIAN